jgi:hypothetical protein
VAAGGIALALALSACGGGESDPATTSGTNETAPAAGSSTMQLNVKLDPEETGTADRPRPVRVAVDVRIQGGEALGGEAVGQGAAGGGSADPDEGERAGEVDDPPVRAVDLEIPPGVVFRPDELTACAAGTLAAEGPTGCPDASRLGTGTVQAGSGTIDVEGEATAIYRGDDRVALWVEIANPVSVGEAIEGRIESRSGGGYRLGLAVPAALQEIAGLPVSLERINVSLGRGGALATTACPEGGLPFRARFGLTDGRSIEGATRAACQ